MTGPTWTGLLLNACSLWPISSPGRSSPIQPVLATGKEAGPAQATQAMGYPPGPQQHANFRCATQPASLTIWHLLASMLTRFRSSSPLSVPLTAPLRKHRASVQERKEDIRPGSDQLHYNPELEAKYNLRWLVNTPIGKEQTDPMDAIMLIQTKRRGFQGSKDLLPCGYASRGGYGTDLSFGLAS